MTEVQLPNFTLWLREQRDGLAEAVGTEGAEVVYTQFERVQRNMIGDKPMFDMHTSRAKDDVVTRARMQGVEVKDVHVVVLKPEHLSIGDREELFPQHAKYTSLIYYFGWTAPEQDWEPLGEDVSMHTMFLAIDPHEDGRLCAWHSRLHGFVFDGTKKCLREGHTTARDDIRAPWEN